MTALDSIDRMIIGVLATDGRISVRALAERISLSASATSDRLHRLEQSGVITGYRAEIDPVAVGVHVHAVVDVQLDPAAASFDIDDVLADLPEVVDAFHLTGRFDYQLRIACREIADIESLLRRLKEDHGVRETSTRVILRSVPGMPRTHVPDPRR